MIQEKAICGDCLMGIGIPDGGIAVIDRNMEPNVFDVVWCTNPTASISGYLKQIVQTGAKPIVQTCYIDKAKDYMFYAPEILGVVLKVMDHNRNVVWERPSPTEYALVRHGRWIKEWSDIPGREIEHCSECQAEMHDRNQFWDAPYCPLCGAKMDLEE